MKSDYSPTDPLIARSANSLSQLSVTAAAAFVAYFCMYAFRKPFTAATYPNAELWGMGLKSVLVVAQLLGYTLSKFIGIKVISEMRSEWRAIAIIGLIGFAELALVGFAVAPIPYKVVMIFLNGLPLGMIFGLILSYLEGRKQTEALSAALCASFIVSSGVVKSLGSWLVTNAGISEFAMPMIAGGLFLLPLLAAVWFLQRTPPPDTEDQLLRSERSVMNAVERRQFLSAYWPALTLLIVVYVALTIARTVRDDFAVEIWRDMGVTKAPSVFARTEIWVGIIVTASSATVIWIKNNWSALQYVILLMCFSFGFVGISSILKHQGVISPFMFMIYCGIGLYIPYVMFHTTVFERLIALSRLRSNLGFLMYMADSIGYLGYAAIIISRTQLESTEGNVLDFFQWTLTVCAGLSIISLFAVTIYLRKRFPTGHSSVLSVAVQQVDSAI